MGETGERVPLADVRLRAPIVPKKFFHTAGNFSDHHEELQAVDWSHPVHKGIVFFQNVDAIIGPDDAIVYPEGLTKELDYELELAIIIGRSGKFFGPSSRSPTSSRTTRRRATRPATSSPPARYPAWPRCNRTRSTSTPSPGDNIEPGADQGRAHLRGLRARRR
ncbi:MAG: fumarylacetoacetate hydrolase family protein [Streptosporangiaceae bacterium]